ncbi:MAG: AMIN domain-containing protein [Elusimicrobiales bacterium]|nr:AMIN domain-containing protein [Elusimicrobiales bacterium]MCK5105923.1 AMIN domain-containing protein [Elusimicrobiales bacterium]
MRRIISLITISIFFLTQNSMILCAAINEATVKSVRVSAESVYIRTDKPVEHKAFMISNPPKIVIDLMNTKLKTLEEIPARGTFLKRVRTGQYKTQPNSISRIVLELSQKIAYDVVKKGNDIMIVLGGKVFKKKAKKKDSPNIKKSVKVIVPENKDLLEAKLPVISVKTVPKRIRRSSISKKQKEANRSKDIMASLPKYSMNLDYIDADIKDVINMMVAKIGINVIFASGVSNNITIKLNDVPFDEAFRTILNVNGLATQQVGDNILRIASPKVFIAEAKKAMPQTKVFFLDYAKSADIMTQVLAAAAAKKRSLTCSVDTANNAIVITDTPMGLEEDARLIRDLDRQPRQVLIEVKLVEVALNNDFNLGIQWSIYGADKDGDTRFSYGDANNKVTWVDNMGTTVGETQLPLSGTGGGTGVNLPANIIYGAFRLGKITSGYIFDSVISAAASKGKAKVLSDPKIATLNNKEATINITTQIPYTTSETTGSTPPITTTVVTYLTTGIVLKVLPTITSTGKVSLKLNPDISQVSPTITAVAGGAPGIDTRSIDTEIIVADGETVVIGGLIHDYKSEGEFKIPLLGDLPLLGWLFKKKTNTRERRELLIFVTPKILH